MNVKPGQSLIVFPPLPRIGERWNAARGLVLAALTILLGKETRVLFTRSTNLDPDHSVAQALLTKE